MSPTTDANGKLGLTIVERPRMLMPFTGQSGGFGLGGFPSFGSGGNLTGLQPGQTVSVGQAQQGFIRGVLRGVFPWWPF